MIKPRKYKVLLSMDAIQDIADVKTYILEKFKYREYAIKFSKEIKKAIKSLATFAEGYEKSGYVIEGLEVFYKPYNTYMIFFVVENANVIVIRVLKDRMHWKGIIRRIKR